MSDNFTFFMPLAKVDKERRLVSGYASTPAIDLDGESVSLDAVRKALPGYMQWRNIREMHTNSAVGVAREANIDDKGLFLTARIVDDAAWQKVEEGVYKGFSIGGRKIAKSGNTITEIELIEVSVVDRPANPECKIEVTKSAGPALFARLPKRDARDRALGAMAKAVSAMSKAGPPAAKDGFSLPAKVAGACEAHGKVDCEDCAEVAKRDFDTKQRDADAKSGAALSDGSFPIENESDLKNAIRAIGRAKDKKAAKRHIVTRARALGATGALPEKWQKKVAKKDAAKAAKRAAKSVAKAANSVPTAMPAFLTLTPVGGVVEDAGGLVERSHELDLGRSAEPQAPAAVGGPAALSFSKRERKLVKRMGVAASLSYCFDSIREAQRSLLLEAKREGGDRKDAALAEKLGTLAQGVAAVIGQKAEHEGAEALDLSDADDQGFASLIDEGLAMSGKNAGGADVGTMILDLLKRANEPDPKARMKMARKGLKKADSMIDDCAKAVKAAHAMHKAAYLAKGATAKAAKKPNDGDADDFDHAGAMEKLQKAYGNLSTMKTLVKGAGAEIKKAASGVHVTEGNAFYNVPTGVEGLSIEDLSRAGPGTKEQGGEPPLHSLEGVFPGKSAKASYSRDEMEAALRVAGAEAESAALRKVLEGLPAGGSGRRPAAFDLSKLGSGATADGALMKGVNAADLDSQDENKRASAVGTVLTNMIQGGHGKSVFDPGFHGTAGTGISH